MMIPNQFFHPKYEQMIVIGDVYELDAHRFGRVRYSGLGVIIVRCHHTRAMALGAFYLDAGG